MFRANPLQVAIECFITTDVSLWHHFWVHVWNVLGRLKETLWEIVAHPGTRPSVCNLVETQSGLIDQALTFLGLRIKTGGWSRGALSRPGVQDPVPGVWRT